MSSGDFKKFDTGLTDNFTQKRKRRPKPKVLEGSKWTYFDHATGWCHFHIVTNQKRGDKLWVELMASCERETRFWLPWDHLADPERGWHMGWVKKETISQT